MKENNERFARMWQEATLFDDWFMQLVLKENVPCMTLFLAVCLNDCQITLSELHIQDPFASEERTGRDAVFDVWARDVLGNTYNLEIQNASEGASPVRAFHNLSLMVQYEQPKGEKHEVRKNCYVIFITRNDYLGDNLPCQYLCGYKTNGEDAGIRAYIIYINGDWKADDPIGRLVHDMKEPDPDKMHYREIADSVRRIKCSMKEAKMSVSLAALKQAMYDDAYDEAYDKAYDDAYDDAYDEGVNDGERRRNAFLVKNLLNKGFDVNFIREVTGLSEEEFVKIQKAMDGREKE